jgi:peptidyl-prolyl cis-trans isomerase D
MITWMQKHNKYLVWTIWIATIAFIGAGVVGWGSYDYGSKASAVGRVGDVEISRAKLTMTYQNLYERYNQMFQGKFDEEQARKMGLLKQAFDSLAAQAQLLNLARQYGIIVSDEEVADYIASIPAFQENGVFNRSVYKTYLKNRGIKMATYESILADDLTVRKLMGLIEHDAVPFEMQTVASALSVEDKVAYRVITPEAVAVELNASQIRQAWEANKEQYLTPRTYELALLWTGTDEINVTADEVRAYYDKNSFNYADAEGVALPFEQAKKMVEHDLKIKKGKKQALLDYIAFKKGKKSPEQTRTLAQNDATLPAPLWKEIASAAPGSVLKPKVVGSRYVTVRLERVNQPHPKTFEEARAEVERQLRAVKSSEKMDEAAQALLNEIDKADLTTSDYLNLTKPATLAPLSAEESLQFLQKLFTSSEKKGIIRLSKSLVVYRIVDQKMRPIDTNLTQAVRQETNRIKKSVFEEALFQELSKKYPVEAYAKGL